MTNRPTSPAIPLTLEGVEYAFRLDFTAMADFEQATGKGVLELFGEVFGALMQSIPKSSPPGADDAEGADHAEATKPPQPPDFSGLLAGLHLKASDLQALTWACLGGEDSGLTLREAGRLIHPGNLQEVVGALTAALRSALPEAKPEAEQSRPPPAAAGPDGLPSGASGDNHLV